MSGEKFKKFEGMRKKGNLEFQIIRSKSKKLKKSFKAFNVFEKSLKIVESTKCSSFSKKLSNVKKIHDKIA